MIVRLKDAIKSVSTGADAIQRAPIVEYDTGVKCLRIGDISNKRKYTDWGFSKVNEDNYRKYKLKKGDIIVARTGSTVGINKYIQKDYNAVYNNGLIRLEVDELKYDRKFIYYIMQTQSFKNYINGIAFGTTGQPNIQINDLLNFKFNYLPLELQHKIVKVIDSLNKKIELNNQINDNLFEISRMDFEKLYQNNKLWNECRIDDLNLYISDYVANGSFKSLSENVRLYDEKEYALFIRNTDLKVNFTQERKYVDKHSYDFLKKSQLFGRELIISNVGDVGSIFLCPSYKFPMSLGNNVIMVDSKNLEINYNYYLYYFFKSNQGQHLIDGITGGSAQPKFNKTDFRTSRIRIPSKDELEAFNKKVIPIYNKIELNIFENETLAQLRDTLLPKLMNGEIDLDKIEI